MSEKSFYTSPYTFCVTLTITLVLYVIMMLRSTSIEWWNNLILPFWSLNLYFWITMNVIIIIVYTFSTWKVMEKFDEKTNKIIFFLYILFNVLSIVQTYLFIIKRSTYHFIPLFAQFLILIVQLWYTWEISSQSISSMMLLILTLIMFTYIMCIYYKIWSDNS